MDWIGNAFIVLGLWGIGSKRRGAFLFSIIGEAFWIAYASSIGLWSLAFICVVFLLLAARGYIKWGEAPKEAA